MKFANTLIAIASLVASAPAFASIAVTNGSFEDVSVPGKSTFAGHVAGWSGGDNLTFIDYPGTADDGSYLSVYPGFPHASPAGGNFVEADGDPTYSSAISQTISGLTVGNQYNVSFYQAAGQQLGFTGPTTERWQVSFGNDTQLSDQYSLPQAGVGGWQSQTLTFTASATEQVLSFLAKGTPNGAPPISFLDGVTVAPIPETTVWTMMILGVGMIGATVRGRNRATPALA